MMILIDIIRVASTYYPAILVIRNILDKLGGLFKNDFRNTSMTLKNMENQNSHSI